MESRTIKKEAEKRVAAQLSDGIGNLDEEVRNKVVTAVIDNGGSLDDLQQTCRKRWTTHLRGTCS
jgi:dephospho-CoA kinase